MRRCVAEILPCVVGEVILLLLMLMMVVMMVVDVSSMCHLPRQSFVVEFLLPSAIELFLVVVGLWEIFAHVGWVVVIGVVSLFVEPEAGTSFPLDAAGEAELGTATTSHVVAAFDLLDRSSAVVTALPTFPLSHLDEFLGCGVFGAFTRGVPFVVAETADFGLAAVAFPVFAAVVGAAAGVGVDVGGLDPFTAAFGGAVEAVFGGVFLVFAVPFYLEVVVEEFYYVF